MISKEEWFNTPEPSQDPYPGYQILGEPDKVHREAAWRIAIGLQDVDHLRPSEFLIDVANKNIEGEITSAAAKEMIDEYHLTKEGHSEKNRTREADLVASRINTELQEDTFNFSPVAFLGLHARLFQGIFKAAGKIRDYNIEKSEWVLNGASVHYGRADLARDTLFYDIEEAKKFDFDIVEENIFLEHITKFITNLWQNHVFCEGNTRTCAVFLIKYLRNLGFDYINNDMFEKYSWYFRNALVRANYQSPDGKIKPTSYFLVMFLRNLILGEHNELHNRDIHVNNIDISKALGIEMPASNNLTMNELQVLNVIKNNPNATQAEIAKEIKRSVRTVKTLTKRLSDKGAIVRENGKRFGYWVVKF